MRNAPAVAVLLLASLFASHNAAHGKTISLNFGADISGAGGQTLLPEDLAGVVPAKNWNNILQGAPGGSIGTYPNLKVDDNGVASDSGVDFVIDFDDLSAHVGGVVTNEGVPLTTPNRKMMNAYADVLGPSSSNMTDGTVLQFTNLDDFGPFDLYLYNAGTIPPGDPNRVARYDFRDGTSESAPLIVSRYGRNESNPFHVPNDVFIEQSDDGTIAGSTVGNYYVVRNLNPSSGSLFVFGDAINPFGRPARGAINGIQLVSVDVAGPTGDFNGNGIVDAADYVVWRDSLGQSATPHGSGADGNGNGTIDPGDYDFWKSKFGDVISGAGVGAVANAPEPGSILLMLTAVTGLVVISRRRLHVRIPG